MLPYSWLTLLVVLNFLALGFLGASVAELFHRVKELERKQK